MKLRWAMADQEKADQLVMDLSMYNGALERYVTPLGAQKAATTVVVKRMLNTIPILVNALAEVLRVMGLMVILAQRLRQNRNAFRSPFHATTISRGEKQRLQRCTKSSRTRKERVTVSRYTAWAASGESCFTIHVTPIFDP